MTIANLLVTLGSLRCPVPTYTSISSCLCVCVFCFCPSTCNNVYMCFAYIRPLMLWLVLSKLVGAVAYLDISRLPSFAKQITEAGMACNAHASKLRSVSDKNGLPKAMCLNWQQSVCVLVLSPFCKVPHWPPKQCKYSLIGEISFGGLLWKLHRSMMVRLWRC